MTSSPLFFELSVVDKKRLFMLFFPLGSEITRLKGKET
jgi:hypothetical protein